LSKKFRVKSAIRHNIDEFAAQRLSIGIKQPENRPFSRKMSSYEFGKAACNRARS
jgi:hypothetical protein